MLNNSFNKNIQKNQNIKYINFTHLGNINHSKLCKNQNIKITCNSNKTDFDRIKPKAHKLIHNLNDALTVTNCM